MDGNADELKLDKWGYPVKTSSDDCISAINSFYDQFLAYGRKRSVILEAPKHDEHCVLANILAAHFLSNSNPNKAKAHLASAEARREDSTSYEKAVFDAILCLMSQDRDDDIAIDLHSKLLKQFPRDLVSLKRAQVLCFYLGRPDLSLGFVDQVLPENQQMNYVYGMLAFPLLELGRMAEAEEAARKGLKVNKHDLWSQHNLCHVFQYECRFKEAVEFMEECSPSWSSCSSFMYTHNWWHVSVCYLDGNSPITKVLEVYDNYMWKELQRPDAASVEVYLNALALLLRVYVHGKIDLFVGRLKMLADCVRDQSIWNMEWHLDILILWVLAYTDRGETAEDLLKAMKFRISSMSTKKQRFMRKGILLAEALYKYGRGNYQHAYELLGPEFDAKDCKMIGASDEQLDVFNEVWYSVLLNCGQFLKATEVLEKRIKEVEGIPFLWRLLEDGQAKAESTRSSVEARAILSAKEKGYSMAGRNDEATDASRKAQALEIAYFKQTE